MATRHSKTRLRQGQASPADPDLETDPDLRQQEESLLLGGPAEPDSTAHESEDQRPST